MKKQPKFNIGDEVYAVHYDSVDKRVIWLRKDLINNIFIYGCGDIKYELQHSYCKYGEEQLILSSDEDTLLETIQCM